MALEVNNVKTSQITTPTTSKTDAGSSTVSNKPIDFSNKEITNNSEITAYINTEEFKNLKPEEQVQQLKTKFFPSYDIATVQQYLTTAKQAIAASQTTEQEATTTPSNETPVSNTTSTADTVTTGATETPTAKSQLENDVDAYIEQTKFKGDIDDLKAQLLQKQKSSQSLTPEELKILTQLQQNDKILEEKINNITKVGISKIGKTIAKGAINAITNIHEFNEQNLISMKTLLSEEFRQKTPSEKLNILTDAYLGKNYPDYKNLSDEEKKEIREKEINKILDILDPDNSKLSPKEQNKLVMDAASLLQYAHSSNVSIEDLKKMPADALKVELQKAKQEQLNNIIKLIPQDELKGKTPEQKVMMYADLILSSTDDEYNKLEGKEKEAYLANKADDFLENNLGIKGWKNLPAKEKEHLFKNASGLMCMLAEEGITYQEYMNFSTAKKTSKLIQYYEKNDYKVPPTLKAKNNIIKELEKQGIEEPKEKDVFNYLTQQEKLGKISKAESPLLKEMRAFNNIIGGKSEDKKASNASNLTYAEMLGCDTKTYITHQLEDITPENIASNKKSINMLIDGAINDRDIEQINTIKEILTQKGFSKEQIDALITPESYAHFAAQGYVDNDGKTSGQAIAQIASIKDANAQEMAIRGTEISSQYLEKDELQNFGEEIVPHEKLVPAFTKSLNNRQHISLEDAAEVSMNLVKSDNVSNASKAIFTQNMIESAKVNGPQEQVYFGKEFSSVDNAAVIEGLAAASKSVDSSVQAQYNSYIDNAIKKFPPEQQSVIQSIVQTARETGTISQTTLTQQTPPLQSNNTNSSSNNNTVKTSTATQSQQGTRTVATATPTKGTAPKVKTTKTQTTENVSVSNTSRALKQKVNIIADRIIEFETKKAENTKVREQQRSKNQAATTEEIKNSSAQSSTNISKAQNTSQTANSNETLLNQADEHILKEIFNTGGITALYDALVEKTGNNNQEIFFEKLVQFAKPSDVISFANSYKHNKDVLLTLINYCPNKEMKFDLLNMLPSQTINELISTQRINSTDFEKLVRNGKVDSKTIIEFLKKNKSGMSADELKKYSSFLSLSDRNLLAGLITEKMGVEKGSDEWLRLQQQNMRTSTSVSPQTDYEESNIPSWEDALEIGSTKVPMSRGYDKMKKTGHTYFG